MGKDFIMKNANPEIPIAKATGIPSTKKTRNIIIAVDMIYLFPHSDKGVFMDLIRFIAVLINIKQAPTGTHEVTHA